MQNYKMEPSVIKSEQQKQIYDFLTASSPNLSVPEFLREMSLRSASTLLNQVVPMMGVVSVGKKQKQVIADFMERILLKHQQLGKGFESIESERDQTSKLTIINQLISLPNHFLNLISQPKLTQDRLVNISNLQQHKQHLYFSILGYAQTLQIESQILVINRLLVLGYHKTVIDYFLSHNQPDFIVTHIPHFSKAKNIISSLYQSYILQKSTQSQGSEQLRKMLVNLANSQFDLSESFYFLLNLDCKYHHKNLYRQYYSLIKNTKVQNKICTNLLKWWAISKNYIITQMHSRIRCNILYLFINDFNRKELVQGDLSISIIQGIKRKLTDGASKVQALLIWKAISKKMELPKTQQVENSKQFEIVSEHSQEKVAQRQTIVKEKCFNQNSVSYSETKLKQNYASINESQKLDGELQQNQEIFVQLDQLENKQPQLLVIRPKNIYDCLLSLKNQSREAIALQQLLLLINKNQEDLVLMWNSLMQQLLSSIKDQYRQVLVALIDKRPEQFIESVGCYFMTRQTNVGQKIQLMIILSEGIEKLSTAQNIEEKQQQNQNFYFKKIKSRYLKQPETKLEEEQKQKRIQQKSRRWGHTRIEHQRKSKETNLHIVDSIVRINRFYPVSNLIFYKIIDIFAIDIVNSLRKHQIFVQNLLRLLAVFTSNIKNHFQKQILLTDICTYCLKILQELISGNQAKRYEESGGQTMMLCLQVVNKVALVLDKFTNESVMSLLKMIVQGARKLPNYGMNSILDLIEANIYQKVYGSVDIQY